MAILDVTEYFAACYEGVVKAERRGGDVLILFSDDGDFELVYRWLVSEHAELARVLGSELTRWTKNEIDLAKPLFEQFRLFP